MTSEQPLVRAGNRPVLPHAPDVLAAPGMTTGRSETHIAGLDGIRAVAVVAVLAFHGGVSWAGGGLLGVDVFFVLSGFLITSLLVEEWTATGKISLRRFYARRARRLLPALCATLVLVAAYAQWFAPPSSLATLRGDAYSTLAYVANWRFIATGQDYFVRFGPPSPLLHTWSLAVEEQFYLVWPVLALVALRRGGRRAVAALATAGIVLSAVVTVVLYRHGAGVSRLYYGTDTRVQEIMSGALVAVALPAIKRWVTARGVGPRGGGRNAIGSLSGPRLAGARVGGIVAAGLLGAAVVGWCLHTVSGGGGFLYQGGFLVVAWATAAVVVCTVVCPTSVLARILALRGVTYVGRISYGLYLYHYPLFLMLDGEHTGLSGATLLAVRSAAALAAAVVSYHALEMPIRSRRAFGGARLGVALATAVVVAMALVVVSTRPPTSAPATATERAALTVPRSPPPGLTGAHPVRVLLLGDSLALTLGTGLGAQANAWGATVVNRGVIGCDLDPDSTVNIEGSVTQAAQGCAGWPQTWQSEVDHVNPDVVAVLLGRWEVSDRLVDGRWTRIGQPQWDDLLSAELDRAIAILTSRGAHVVFFTLPYITQTTEAPDGTPWDINRPARTDEYNAVVRAAARRHPGTVSVIDLNRLLDPGGVYTNIIDGVRVRDDDQEHISPAGGMFVRSTVLPTLVRLGLSRERARTARTTGSEAAN